MELDSTLLPLVHRLYDAATRERGISDGLEATALAFGATVSHLVASDPSSQVPRWALSTDTFGGALLGASQRYDGGLFRVDPRRVSGMARLARHGAWHCGELLGEREVSRSAFFQDFFLPIGLRYSMVVRLPAPAAGSMRDATSPHAAAEYVDLAIVRGPDHQPFDEAAVRRLRSLAPHLQTALALQRQSEALRTSVVALGAAATDALVLDERSGLLAATPGAAQHVGSVFGRLVFGQGAHRRGQPQVDAALAATRADGLPRHVGLGPAQGLGERLWLSITRRTATQGGFELLVLMRWPDRRHAPEVPVLQDMLGLTRREAEIGCALLQGRTPREMWVQWGLSPATVRSQLRSLYAKTGTSGQVEFVRLVAQLTQGVGSAAPGA